jgi:LmbE family N-acetylglucosaminyl deacetylase
MKKQCLIIEPHSDDGAISIGGFLEKYRNIYDYSFLLVVASDLQLRHSGLLTREQRLEEFQSYVSHFNGKWLMPEIDGLTLPLDSDSLLDVFPRKNLVALLELAVEDSKPDVLMVTGPSFHHDHTAVYEATIAALRPTARFLPQEVYILENPTYVHSGNPLTKFTPDTYVSLDEKEILLKIENFRKFFPSQVRHESNYLSPEGLKAWARYRGIESRTMYAEAFTTFFKKL